MNLLESVKGHLNAILTGFKYLFLEKRMTVMYPEELIEPRPGYRGMIRFHKEKCISCSLCARICPAAAIKMYKAPGKKKPHPTINYQRCIFCGFCVSICPTNALEHTKVYDIAEEEMENLILLPDELAKERKSPTEAEGARKVKVVYDEVRGIVHIRK